MVKLKQILFLEMFASIMLNAGIFIYCESIRDPFYLTQSSKADEKSETIKLSGIIQSASKICAIIAVDGIEESVFVGDKIAGFKVAKISAGSVFLVKGKIIKKLFV